MRKFGVVLLCVLILGAIVFLLPSVKQQFQLSQFIETKTPKQIEYEANVARMFDVPTGEPGDPFDVTIKQRGDGWHVLDAGAGLLSGFTQYHWIDDKTVIFIANNMRPLWNTAASYYLKRDFGDLWRPTYLFQWNVEEGVSRLVDKERANRFCYYNGKLRSYFFKDNLITKKNDPYPINFVVEGPLDDLREREYQQPQDVKVDRDENFSFSAPCFNSPRPEGLNARIWYPLLPGHGYLHAGYQAMDGAREENPTWKYTNEELGVEKDLRIPKQIISRRDFYKFKNAFFLSDGLIDADAYSEAYPKCFPVWWLSSYTAEVETLCLPYLAKKNQAFKIIPAKTGFLYFTTDGDEVGIYFLRHGQAKPEKIIDGYTKFKGVNLSPDGCRVAYSIASSWSAFVMELDDSYRTQILDVCNGDSNIN